MKRQERNAGKILDQFFDRLPRPSAEQIEISRACILNRLGREAGDVSVGTMLDDEPVRPIWKRKRPFLLAAAAIIIAILIPAAAIFRNGALNGQRRAIVAIGNGSLLSAGQSRPFKPGQKIQYGDIVSSSGNTEAVITLADGSRIEMRTQSEISLEPAADGVRIRLNSGSVIVTAAKQRFGHLYVQTRDCTVSVVGTVFLVTADEVGSRVAVIQGEVHVQHGTTLKALLPGEQVATTSSMKTLPVAEQISWSLYAAAHLQLLKEFAPVPEAALEESGRGAAPQASSEKVGATPATATPARTPISGNGATIVAPPQLQPEERAAAAPPFDVTNLRPKSPGLDTTSNNRVPDILKVDVETVQFYVTVTDAKGRFVTDLQPDNFKVSEDGKQQHIEAFSSDDSPLSVGVLFDVNGTMGNNFPLAKETALSFLRAGNLRNQYFILAFNDKPQIAEDYTSDLDKLKNYVPALSRSHDQDPIDAIYSALEKLRSATTPRKVLLVFTTGGNLKSEHKASQVRDLARQLDVQIYGISIAETEIHGYLDGDSGMDVIESVGGETFIPDKAPDFLVTGRKLAVALRNQYIIGYHSTNAEHDGKYRRLKVNLVLEGAPELFVHTREGYYARGPER